MIHNNINKKYKEKADKKLKNDVEKLKDNQREFANGNSHD